MAEMLIDKAFKILYKQMVQQDKKAEENGQDIERYYIRQSATVFMICGKYFQIFVIRHR